MTEENRKVIFQKGEFHDFEHTVVSFYDDAPIDEFITLPACWIDGDKIEYWAETYRWMGTQDDQGRFIYRHASSKFVRSQKRGWQESDSEKSQEVAK